MGIMFYLLCVFINLTVIINVEEAVQVMKKIFCWLGIHDWWDILDNKIFPYTSYKYCSRCYKIQLNFKLK